MFDNLSFKVMESSLRALWLKQNVTVHNLANMETPGYKAKSVSFQGTLAKARAEQQRGRDAGTYRFQAVVSTDDATSILPDGNNVDVDRENAELMNTYIQTLALYQKIGGQISDARYVIKQAFK